MANLFAITCPHCRVQGKGPIELNGKKIRCRSCGRVFLVQLAKKPTAPTPAAQVKTRAPGAAVREEPPKAPETYAFEGEGASRAPGYVPPIAELEVSAVDDEESNPYGLKDVDLARRCPFCAKEMEEEDIICLNCGYNTQTRKHHQTERTYANTPGEIFLWLLPGVLSVLGIFAAIGFDLFWWFGLESAWWKPMDNFTGLPSLSLGVRVWEVVISLFAMYHMGKFAIRRLILHPSPPEVVKH